MLQNCIESPQMKILIKQVTNRSRKSREFINCYLVREQNTPKFVKQITATSKHIWEDIVGDVLLTEDNRTYYLNVILSYAAIECIKENDFVLPDSTYIEKYVLSLAKYGVKKPEGKNKMREYSRVLIEEYCMEHDSAKSRRLEKLERKSYDLSAEAEGGRPH